MIEAVLLAIKMESPLHAVAPFSAATNEPSYVKTHFGGIPCPIDCWIRVLAMAPPCAQAAGSDRGHGSAPSSTNPRGSVKAIERNTPK
jgi:hypothetical protein